MHLCETNEANLETVVREKVARLKALRGELATVA